MNLDRRLLAETRSARIALALTVGTGFLTAVAIIFQAGLLSRAVTAVFLEGGDLEAVATPMALLLVVVVARALLVWSRDVSAFRLSERIRASLRRRLLDRVFGFGPSYTAGERTGELVNTILEGVESLDSYFSQYLPSLLLALLIPATILLFVFPVDLLSGVVFLVTAPLIPLFMVLIGKAAEALTRRQWDDLSRMNAHFLDVLQGLATLKLFNRSRFQGEAIRSVTARFRDTTLGVLRVAFLSALVLEITGSISTAIVAVEVGLRLLYSSIGFEQAFFVLVLAPEFYLPLRTLGASFHAGMSGAAAARRIYEVLGEGESGRVGEWAGGRGREKVRNSSLITHHSSPPKSSVPSPQSSISPSPPPPLSHSRIEFDNVSLSYEGGGRRALKGVSLEIKAGETVALVGPSGAGKSSMAALLLRFVEPDGGAILVDGVPLGDTSPEEWRRLVAWIPQDPYLFHGSVADNIRLGRPDATESEVIHSASLAGADGFIRSLPQGYDTQLGERAVRLSGGQAQRIALARAFLKDAPLLILDEPTSHLDPEVQAAVQEGIDRLSEGRTVLVIDHRLSTVRRADRIVVLDEGTVVESGTHGQLLAQGGLYARLTGAGSEEVKGEGRRVKGEEGGGVAGRAGGSSPADAMATAVPGMPGGSPLVAPANDPIPGTREFTLHPSPFTLPSLSPFLPHSLRLPILLHLLRLVSPYGWWMALSAALGFATVGAGVGLIATAAFLIAGAALHPSVADLSVAIVGVRFFGISRGIFRYLERYVSHSVTFRLLGRLRVWFYEAIEPLAPARLSEHRSGDLLSRVVADVESLQHFYVRVIAPPLVALAVVLAMGFFFLQFDGGLAATFVLFLALGGVGVPALSYWLGYGPGAAVVKLKGNLSTVLVESIQGLADILVFNQGRERLGMLNALSDGWLRNQRTLALAAGFHGALGVLLSNAGSWAVLVIAIPLVREGKLEGVYLPVLALAALAAFEAVAPLPLAVQQLGSSVEAGGRLMGIGMEGKDGKEGREGKEGGPTHLRVSAPPREPSRPSVLSVSSVVKNPLPSLPSCPSPLVVLRNVRFRYGQGEPWVLDDVSLEVPTGKRVALVGPSGVGKSTVANLLLRFWDYEEGSIELAGRDLRSYGPEETRDLVTAVPQRIHLFNTTIRGNLLLARPDASVEQMVGASRQARLHGFVETLPSGYETQVGEQGTKLSGGERQRIGIARALLRNAGLLILDEPGSGLDGTTEREVLDTLVGGDENRSVLLITHSISALEAVDEVFVLHEGRVAERGSHAELLRAGGIYRRMWELQKQTL